MMEKINKLKNITIEKTEYYTQEKISSLKVLMDTAFSEKSSYEALWRKIAGYCGLNKFFYNERQNDKKTDVEINNSQAVISLNQSSDSMLGILIGNGDFFKLKIKDSILDLLKEQSIEFNSSSLDEYLTYVNNVIQEQLFNKESNFTKNLQKTIKEYFAFGNAGMGVFKNNYVENDPVANYSSSHLNFVNYSINNCAFLEGKSGNIDNIFIKYNWSVKKIVETFCFDEFKLLNEDKFNDLPEEIKNSYNNKQTKGRIFKVNYILTQNPERKKEAINGIYSANYVGLFIDFDNKYIFAKEYFKNNPIKIIRDNIRTGETYGKGNAGNIISDIELVNTITGDMVENIENSVNPYLAMYENVIDDSEITLSRDRPLILRAPKDSPNINPPIFPVIQNGDIANTVNVLLPQLQNNISSGLKSDVFLDFNNKTDMTARESMIRYNIRNKVLFANALDFQTLLNHLIFNSYRILAVNNIFQKKKNEAINFLDSNNIDWFDIEYTSELAQISKNSEIETIGQFINTMAAALSIAPQDKQLEAVKKINFNAIADDIARLFNKSNYLFSEEEFKQMMTEEQEANLQMAQQQQALTEADLMNRNAQAMKTQREAMMPMGNNNYDFY